MTMTKTPGQFDGYVTKLGGAVIGFEVALGGVVLGVEPTRERAVDRLKGEAGDTPCWFVERNGSAEML